MNRIRIDQLRVPPGRRKPYRSRLWREWCFLRAALTHLRIRLALMAVILLIGALAFKNLEPEKGHSLPVAMYYTWSLVFGQPPEAFPNSVVLQALFFLIPVVGFIVIIEGIVDLSVMIGNRRRYERTWCKVMASKLSNHIILVGFGKLGFRTYRLLTRLGEIVVVIERDEANQFLEEARHDGSPILIGDARREILLMEGNIQQAKSIIVGTDDDLANLEIALDARRLAPSIRVVLRMFDQNMADKIRDGFSIHIAMSQAAISAPAFAVAAIERSYVGSFIVGDQLVVMQQRTTRAGDPLAGKTIGEITGKMGISIIEHRPAGGAPRLFPPPETLLQLGDDLLIQGPLEVFESLVAAS